MGLSAGGGSLLLSIMGRLFSDNEQLDCLFFMMSTKFRMSREQSLSSKLASSECLVEAPLDSDILDFSFSFDCFVDVGLSFDSLLDLLSSLFDVSALDFLAGGFCLSVVRWSESRRKRLLLAPPDLVFALLRLSTDSNDDVGESNKYVLESSNSFVFVLLLLAASNSLWLRGLLDDCLLFESAAVG